MSDLTAGDGAGAGDVVAEHGPAVAHEVVLEPGQFGGEAGGVGVIHQEDDFAAGLDERAG